MSFSNDSKFVVRIRLVRALGLVAMIAAFAMPVSIAAAQDFQELPIAEKYRMIPQEDIDGAENRRELSQKNRDARAATRDGEKAIQAILLSGGNVNVPATQEYFDGYVFPSMTMAENLMNAGRLRYDFDRSYLGTKYVGAQRKPFIENTIMPGLQKLIDNDKLSPSARVNAVVLMSRLDDAPLIRASKTAPQPSISAFNALFSIWRGDYPEFLKAPALAGILRHIEVDSAVNSPRIPNDRKNELMQSVTSMMDTILADDPELKTDLNRWKVTKSVQLMSRIGLANENAGYFDRMTAMLAKDSKVSKWVKLEAIRGLKQLSMTGIGAPKINSLIESALSFASQSLDEEAVLIQSNVDELVYDNILWDNIDLEATGTNYIDAPTAPTGGGGGMGGMGGMGGGGMGMGGGGMGMGGGGMGMGGGRGMGGGGMFGEEAPKPIVELPNYELNLTRRRMKLVIFSVKELLELEAVKGTATDTHKAGLAPLEARMKEFIEEDSSIGVINLDKVDDDEEEQKESYAMQLKAVCQSMAGELATSVATMRGEPAPARGEVAEEKKAAAAPAAPFGGN